MGRRVTASHEQDLIERWRRTLAPVLAECARPVRPPGRVSVSRLIAAKLEIPLDAETKERARTQLEAAATTLIAAAHEDVSTGKSDAVDQWIVHTLIRKGRRLLIPENRRTAMLVRARDAARRAGRREKKLVSNLVSMPRESWMRLRQVGRLLAMRRPADIITALADQFEVSSGATRPKVAKRPSLSAAPAEYAQSSLDLGSVGDVSQTGERKHRNPKPTGTRPPRKTDPASP